MQDEDHTPHDTLYHIGYMRGRIEAIERKLDTSTQRNHQRIDELNIKMDEMSASLRTSISQNQDKLKTAEIVISTLKWLATVVVLILTLKFGDVRELFN